MAQTKGDKTMITKIKRKKKTVYQARVCVNGIRAKSKVFPTKLQAIDWHDREKENLLNPRRAHKKELEELTFKDVFERYKKERLPLLKKSTQEYVLYKSPLLEEDCLSSTRMCDFSSETVDRWISFLLSSPLAKNKHRKSFIHEIHCLCIILNWYRDYINADFLVPVVKKHRQRCYYKKLASRRPDYFMRPHEVRLWIEELKKSSLCVYSNLAEFMILTGSRIGEACGLKWEEIDFEKSFARIVRIASWGIGKQEPYLSETTKTEESTRLLMLPEELVESLKKRKKESLSELVFCNKKGGILSIACIRYQFNKAFKNCGLSWRGTHICRHTYATMALMATKDLSAVQAALGHTDQKMTQKYAKAVALLNSETAEKTAQVFKLASSKT